jgi:hypothetical protein
VTDLVEFLNAQYDKQAKAAADLKRWAVDGEFAKTLVDPVIGPFNGSTKRRDMGAGLDLITLADPDWVLADIESKRRIVAEHDPSHDPCDAHDANFETVPCPTLCLLAAPFSGEPGYKAEEWAV